MAERKAALFHHSMLEQTAELTDEQFGQLSRALLRFSKDKIEPEKSNELIRHLFNMLKPQQEKDKQSYVETCKKNKANAAKGNKTSKAKPTQQEPTKPTQSDTKPLEPTLSQTEPNTANNNNNNNSLFVNNYIQSYPPQAGKITNPVEFRFSGQLDTQNADTDWGAATREVVGILQQAHTASKSKAGWKFNGQLLREAEFLQRLDALSEEDISTMVSRLKFGGQAGYERVRDPVPFVWGVFVNKTKGETNGSSN